MLADFFVKRCIRRFIFGFDATEFMRRTRNVRVEPLLERRICRFVFRFNASKFMRRTRNVRVELLLERGDIVIHTGIFKRSDTSFLARNLGVLFGIFVLQRLDIRSSGHIALFQSRYTLTERFIRSRQILGLFIESGNLAIGRQSLLAKSANVRFRSRHSLVKSTNLFRLGCDLTIHSIDIAFGVALKRV